MKKVWLISALLKKETATNASVFSHRAAVDVCETKAEMVGCYLSQWQTDGYFVISFEVTECHRVKAIEE